MEISCHPRAHVVKRDAGERHACQGLMKYLKAIYDRPNRQAQAWRFFDVEKEGKHGNCIDCALCAQGERCDRAYGMLCCGVGGAWVFVAWEHFEGILRMTALCCL